MRDRIAQLAYIEAQILHAASNSNLLASATRHIEEQYKLEPQSLGKGVFLETRTLSLLYLLIVVPKEFALLGADHQIYQEIANKWTIENVNVKTNRSNWGNPVYSFIHYLRNAVAHASFDFEGDTFEFWSQWKEKPEMYRACLPLDQMELFLEVVGSTLANYSRTHTAV